MSGENYDEGVERIHTAGASRDNHQRYLRERQQKRLKTRITGLLAALTIVGIGYGSIWYHSRNQDTALDLLNAATHSLESGDYKRAYEKATAAAKTGNYEWHGHFYSAIALTYMNRPQEAQAALSNAISHFKDYYPPLHYFPTLSLYSEKGFTRKEINSRFREATKRFRVLPAFSLYLDEGKVCYPRDVFLGLDYGRGKIPVIACFPEQVVQKIRSGFRTPSGS